MKAKELLYLLGYKPKARVYGSRLVEYEVPPFGKVQYAQWQHPKHYPGELSGREIAELQRFIKPGDFCIDVGAHAGDTCVPMGLVAGPEGRVLAMEPNRYTYAILQENCQLNPSLTNIESLMAAATLADGDYVFDYGDRDFNNGGDGKALSWWRRRRQFHLEVKGVNLENHLRQNYADRLDRLRYIKIDTEGNDLDVLRSIGGILTECQPYVRVELFQFSTPEYRSELYDLLSQSGYEIRLAERGDTLFGDLVSAEQVTELADCDLFCVPRNAAVQAA